MILKEFIINNIFFYLFFLTNKNSIYTKNYITKVNR